MAGSKCPCDMMGGSYYKYNDLRNATPRDFLLSERYGGSCKVGGKSTRKNYRKREERQKKFLVVKVENLKNIICGTQKENDI